MRSGVGAPELQALEQRLDPLGRVAGQHQRPALGRTSPRWRRAPGPARPRLGRCMPVAPRGQQHCSSSPRRLERGGLQLDRLARLALGLDETADSGVGERAPPPRRRIAAGRGRSRVAAPRRRPRSRGRPAGCAKPSVAQAGAEASSEADGGVRGGLRGRQGRRPSDREMAGDQGVGEALVGRRPGRRLAHRLLEVEPRLGEAGRQRRGHRPAALRDQRLGFRRSPSRLAAASS